MKKGVKEVARKRIALAGNPNVGKSTVFNALTGLKQHTGNWPGKTVANASGFCTYQNQELEIFDLPGTYSLIAHSKEEEVARDFLCFDEYDAVIVVCDAVCLERNLNLVLQTLEITKQVVVCVNLLDEAKKKKIRVDLKKLSKELGVPVVGTSARSGKGLTELMDAVSEVMKHPLVTGKAIHYQEGLEELVQMLEQVVDPYLMGTKFESRWVALTLLGQDEILEKTLEEKLGFSLIEEEEVKNSLSLARQQLLEADILDSERKEVIVSSLIQEAEEISRKVVVFEKVDYTKRDRKIDKILTNKWTGIPIMLLLLMVVFWITITGANLPSDLLFQLFAKIEEWIRNLGFWNFVPGWVSSMLLDGVYRVLSWVVAVMLPPMAIFFPLFTLLEDLGFLPRIAFNLDRCFKKCQACGKQALTMCMGFGCNAAGVVGCRIIDSPRERLLAILTNNFVPCNGRFPTIIMILTMFFVGFNMTTTASFLNVCLLTGVILLGIFVTFGVSRVLSKTILKGVPSSFTLELPPYRKPQIMKTIVRSIFDRTLYVLGRAIAIAAPAGLVIWLFANVSIGGTSILSYCKEFLDPIGHVFGLDGAILMGFILGFPANEIVLPIIIMIYMASGSLTQFDNLVALKSLLIDHGWTWLTALCTILFSLMHWPCSTTCLTIKKETGSWKWTGLSILIPTVVGLIICFIVTTLVRFFGLV